MSTYCNDTPSRQAVTDTLRLLVERGLTRGTSGNVSARTAEGGLLITPTGVPATELSPQQVVHMDLAGEPDAEQLIPSSEWRMHADLYAMRPDISAIVHCHSTYATILACAGQPIPAMHYMVAGAGGRAIPLAEYATFGTAALSAAALRALHGCRACLLANHGQIAIGETLADALKLADLVEELAHGYWGVQAMGATPNLLSDEQMDEVLAAFSTYGQQR